MSRRHILPWRTLTVAVAALVAAAAPGAFGLLCYRRDAIADGEVWRLLTGHLLHASATHLRWDVLALVGLGLLFERPLGNRFWTVLGIGALVVGVGLWLLASDLDGYCGLSGVLNAVWVAGALVVARAARGEGNAGLAVLFELCVLADLGKIAVETAIGAPLFTDPSTLGATPIPLAHALGAVAGAIAVFGFGLRRSGSEGPGVQRRPFWCGATP